MAVQHTIRRIIWSALAAGLGAACGNSTSSVATCSSAQATPVTLAVGAYALVNPGSNAGCVAFPANASGTDSAEYLIVAQAAGGSPGDSARFQLRGGGAIAAAVAGPLPAPSSRRGVLAMQFDQFLRASARARNFAVPPAWNRSPTPARLAMAPPTVGSTRNFQVCATLTCSSFQTVTATARAVGGHVAIYVDNTAPAGGLDSADIDSLFQIFEVHVYRVDTTAFARESDIDSNGVVIALMTPTVNRLVTQAQCASSGYVAGFFFPADIDPAFAPQYNDGEIMYTLVGDSLGTLSCAHRASDVKRILPPTLLHELQHMINYNQHVLVNHGIGDDTWLDEGLSKYAEELGGRSFLPGSPSDSATFRSYVIDELYDAGQYLLAPGTHFLVTPTDQDLSDVGAGWLFTRYLADQFGAPIARKLVQTSLTGTMNVTVQTGRAFDSTAGRWALANWVSDLPGFTPRPELTYASWRFRTTFASLHGQFPPQFPLVYPLVPTASGGAQVSVAGVLKAGSGVYVRAMQGPSAAGFTLLFSDPANNALRATIAPRLQIIRIR